jgi:uncharacterized membrane protein YhhN
MNDSSIRPLFPVAIQLNFRMFKELKLHLMKNRTSLILHLFLAAIVVIELVGRLVGNIGLEYPVKPLIMIWMAIYFLLLRQKKSFTIPVLLAFFFSWLGDILLMFSGAYEDEIFFFAGVGGFFLAQLSYIFVFTRYKETGGKGLLERKPWTIILFAGYLGGIYGILQSHMDGIMKVVILVYAITLVGMSVTAMNRGGRVNRESFRLVFSGSILFVISDSLIAINKFALEIPRVGFWIMLTYMAAQYLITVGLTRER